MYLEIDLATVPPTTTLREGDDFKSLSVVVLDAEHAQIPVETLTRLVREQRDTPETDQELAAMLGYAESKGWVTDGQVRAHVEHRPAGA